MAKVTIQQLIDDKIVKNDAQEAKDCDQLLCLDPAARTLLEYKDEEVLQIAQYDDGDIMIITRQGRDHFGEYGVKSLNAKIDIDIYDKRK